MNPHSAPSLSPASMGRSLWRHRELVIRLVRREVAGRYKGSFFGMAWSLFHPMLMLALYTLVFSVVFKARWGSGSGDSKSEFAVTLFAGLMVHALLAEVLNRAPSLVSENISYVKKIVFPLELLAPVAIGAALFHAAISFIVLIAAMAVMGLLHWTALYVPIIVLPLALGALGAGWLVASLAVYLRDVAQVMGILSTVLLFASPVFYPVSAIPEDLRPWMALNPLTFVIEQTRHVLFTKTPPDFLGLTIYATTALTIAWLGYAWFQKTRKGFADVL